MKKISVLMLWMALTLFSCEKAPTKPAPSCLLQNVVGTDGTYSEKVNYNASNEVLSIEVIGSSYTSLVPLRDANNRVYKIDYYSDTTLVSETIYQFDAKGRIVLISTYSYGALSGYQSWTYTNGSHPTEEKLYNVNNGNTVLVQTTDYTYDAQGNVLTAGNISYTYDNKTNATGVLSFMPDVLAGNANNITSQTTKDGNGNTTSSINSTYTYDGNGNVSLRKDINNFGVSSSYIYSFFCH